MTPVPRAERERLRQSFADVFLRQAQEATELAALATNDADLQEALKEILGRLASTAQSLQLPAVVDAAIEAARAVDEGRGAEELDFVFALCRSIDPAGNELPAILVIGQEVAPDPLVIGAPDLTTALAATGSSAPIAVVASVDVLAMLANTRLERVARYAWGESDALEHRLAAAHLGARAYFVAPLDISAISHRIRRRLLPTDADRILLVGAPLEMEQRWTAALNSDGIRVYVCPREEMLVQLSEVDPAAIFLADPRAADLSQVLRGHPEWWDVHRCIVADEVDDEAIDPRVSPSLPVDRVCRRVRALLEHSREEREQRALERATGVMPRAALLRAAEREIATGRRSRRPLALARVDLTEPRALADAHGPAILVIALRLLARAILDIVRTTDIVGRVDDRGYGILMPGATASSVRTRLREIGERFDELTAADGRLAGVFLLAGAADTAESDDDLFQRAERDRLRGRTS